MMPKRVFITGAAKRIGADLVYRLSRDGYDIVLHYGAGPILCSGPRGPDKL